MDLLKQDFQRALSAYFTIQAGIEGRWGGCRFIPHMDGAFNANRHWARGVTTDEKYTFAAAMCMMVLLTQVVWKVKGEDAAYRLCCAMDWPICSAGLGGFLHPLQMMREADLLPEDGAAQKYRDRYLADLDAFRIAMAESVAAFLDDEVGRELDKQMNAIRHYKGGSGEYPERILV